MISVSVTDHRVIVAENSTMLKTLKRRAGGKARENSTKSKACFIFNSFF